MSSTIINSLPGIENFTYLELGIANGSNFRQIKSRNKFSVDIAGGADYTGTTDNFFAGLPNNVSWDIIFIDANHDYDFVLRDYNNSVTRCKKWLLLHDMVPPTPGHVHTQLCSDGYKLLYHMLRHEKFTVYTMDCNFGFTLVKMPAAPVDPDPEIRDVPYSDFMDLLKGVHLYNTAEIEQVLQSSV